MKYTIFIAILFTFLSCDKSFDASKPFSYEKSESKIGSFCKGNSDCKKGVEICDLDNALCVINPCYDIKCGGKGECKVIKDSENELGIECKCNDNYQDNDNDLICELSCNNSIVDNCGANGSCNDSSGKIICICDNKYFLEDEYNCVNPCDSYECNGEHEHCVAESISTPICVCDEDYFRGYNLEEADTPLACIPVCEGIECGANGHCDNIDGKGTCVCNDYYNVIYPDSFEQKCIKSCEYNDCSNQAGDLKGICNDSGYLSDGITKTDNKYCECQFDNDPNDDNNVINYFESVNDYNNNPDDDTYFLECISPCDGFEHCNQIDINSYYCDEDTEISCNNNENCFWSYKIKKCINKNTSYSNIARGKCIASSLTERVCVCDSNYQDINNDLSCNPDCDDGIFDCGELAYCDSIDKYNISGLKECFCPDGYFENGNCEWNNYAWTKVIAGPGNDKFTDILIDSKHNIYITGYFYNTIDFNFDNGIDRHSSPEDIADVFITKINNNGKYMWTKVITANEKKYITSIAIDSNDDIYFTGYFEGVIDFDFSEKRDIQVSKGKTDIFITKINSDASYEWTKIIGGSKSDIANDITIDNNNIYISGYFNGIVDFNPDNSVTDNHMAHNNNCFITKLNSDGSYGWTNTISGTDGVFPKALTVRNDVAYLTGIFEGNINIDNNTYSSNGKNDIFIAKYENDVFKWIKTFGGYNQDVAYDVKINSLGKVYVVGYFQDDVDFDLSDNTVTKHISKGKDDIFITKLSEDGSYEWSNAFGGAESDIAYSIMIDENNDIYVTGSFEGIVDFNYGTMEDTHASNGLRDIFITKIRENGDYLWTKTMGGSADDIGSDILLDSNNDIYIAGTFLMTVDFDITENGVDEYTSLRNDSNLYSSDIFIWKWHQNELICDNIDCNNHGSCNFDGNGNPYCICEMGYQDNDNDLFCEPACDNSDINNCGEHGVCDARGGDVNCLCDIGYRNSGEFKCDKCSIGFSKNKNNNCVSNGRFGNLKIFPATDVFNYYKNVTGNVILSDENGNIYIAGSFSEPISFDDDNEELSRVVPIGDSDIFIVKMNSNFSLDWVKVISGTGRNSVSALKKDGNNLYLTGYFKGSTDFNFEDDFNHNTDSDIDEKTSLENKTAVFVTKLDLNGNYDWTRVIKGGAEEPPYGIFLSDVALSQDNIYIAGYFSDTVDFDPSETGDYRTSNGIYDIFITKFSKTGDYIWTKTIGGTENDRGSSLVIDNSENIYIGGDFKGTVDFDPNNGVDEHFADNSIDIFITKLDNNGNYKWTKTITSDNSKYITKMNIDNSGDIILAGNIYCAGDDNIDFNFNEGVQDMQECIGNINAFITKMSTEGEYFWTKIFKTREISIFTSSIAFDNSDNIYVTGTFRGNINFESGEVVSDNHTSKGMSELFLAKYEDNGNYLWSKTMGSPGDDMGKSIIINGDNDILLLGKFNNNIDFGSPDINDGKDRGVFIWKWLQDIQVCSDISCDFGEKCIEQNGNSGCVCDDGYHLNGNYRCIGD